MALDQLVHAEAQRLWSEFRAAWAKEGKKLKLARALLAIRWVTHDAYSKANVISSWRHCGFEGGQPVNRTKLLVDRCDEIFKSTPGKDGVDFKSGESKWVIPAPNNWQKAHEHHNKMFEMQEGVGQRIPELPRLWGRLCLISSSFLL